MQIILNLHTLSLETQKAIYLALKEKFENFPYKEEPMIFGEDLLNMELADFRDLSVHIFNIFKFAQIRTVRELIQTSKKDLESRRGFGKRSLEQVEEFLQKRGLSLKS